MANYAKHGDWVEIRSIMLKPQERAPQVPDDTKQVPLEMKVKGFLESDAAVGEDAEITTPAGRNARGTLTDINPAYTHQFGPPIPELLPIGRELREMLLRDND